MNQLPRTRFVAGTLLAALLLSSCGGGEGAKKRPPMAKVHGNVTYQGAPVEGAVVSFVIEKAPRAATGVTDAAGNYKLTTYDTNDGAFIGTHKVTVIKGKRSAEGTASSNPTPEDLLKLTREGKLVEASKAKGGIPAKYTDLATTPLQYTIEAGDNEKDIQLED